MCDLPDSSAHLSFKPLSQEPANHAVQPHSLQACAQRVLGDLTPQPSAGDFGPVRQAPGCSTIIADLGARTKPW